MGAAGSTLQRLLVDRYEDLRRRLTRRLGSEDLARETLHETYLRVEGAAEGAQVRNELSYLFRIALNVASDRRRGERRAPGAGDAGTATERVEIADGGPSPGRVVEGRLDLEVLVRALGELTERQRAILMAARLDGVPHQEIADRFGISRRMVLVELKRALVHCAGRLEGEELQPVRGSDGASG